MSTREPNRLVSISRRLLLANAVVLVLALLLLAVTPVTVSAPIGIAELVVLAAGGLVILAINSALVRAAMAPLRHLTEQIEQIDLGGGAIGLPSEGAQVREVQAAPAVDRAGGRRREGVEEVGRAGQFVAESAGATRDLRTWGPLVTMHARSLGVDIDSVCGGRAICANVSAVCRCAFSSKHSSTSLSFRTVPISTTQPIDC